MNEIMNTLHHPNHCTISPDSQPNCGQDSQSHPHQADFWVLVQVLVLLPLLLLLLLVMVLLLLMLLVVLLLVVKEVLRRHRIDRHKDKG